MRGLSGSPIWKKGVMTRGMLFFLVKRHAASIRELKGNGEVWTMSYFFPRWKNSSVHSEGISGDGKLNAASILLSGTLESQCIMRPWAKGKCRTGNLLMVTPLWISCGVDIMFLEV